MTTHHSDQSADVYGSVSDGIGTITLNRPERRNAISTPMLRGTAELLDQMDASPDVGCIVLTGAGSAFCSGGDVLDFQDRGGEGHGAEQVDPALIAQQQEFQRRTVGKMFTMGTPVLASLPGAVAGAGLGFALAADMRIGTARAAFVTAFANVGLAGDYGVAWLLNQLVGPAKARELMYLSPRVDAATAMELGLLNWVVDSEEDLAERTKEIASSIASGPRAALSYMKQNLAEAPSSTLFESMDTEVGRHKACGLTEDHLGAIVAFAKKQKPVFGQVR